MIENNTVFILGAGAHCSYGFPSGEELKSEIVQLVKKSIRVQGDKNFAHLIKRGGATFQEINEERLETFAKALAIAGQGSIDAFIEANKHQIGFQKIGKAAIAQVLLEYERNSTLENNDDDWLSYVFQILIDGVSTPEQFIKNNKISFITFNYDTYLEFWLCEKIKYSFGIDEKSALDVLNQIQIIHVYGNLGVFPNNDDNDQYIWIKASQNIKTIFETLEDDTQIEKAKKLLETAQAICLLGFGFHRENIELLDLSHYIGNCALVCSSRYRISQIEWSRLTRPLPQDKIKAAGDSYQCREALRHLPIF
ncbi:MAG: hypothetical protein CTY16_17405 [Methylobacter sp.]|nr:MAG: hypothetical protein CTY16_17405 [Methylobacter sp.]